MSFQYSLRHSTLARVLMFPFMNLTRGIRMLTYKRGKDAAYIRKLKDSHKGERCFIIGNGPSLELKDLNALKDEFCFGMNRIYELFPKTSWRPQCYSIVDIYMIQRNIKKIQNMEVPIVLADVTAKKYITSDSNIHLINVCDPFTIEKYTDKVVNKIKFSDKADICLRQGYTVTYICIQLAVYMGFKEIYLIGMDHSFSRSIGSNGKVIVNKSIKNHFYSGGDSVDVCQFTNGVEYAYAMARKECEKRGIIIKNATRGGYLEVFERINLDEIINAKEG